MTDLVAFLFFLGVAAMAFIAGARWYAKHGLQHPWFGVIREAHFHGLHSHECTKCGTRWEHDDREFPVGYYNEYMDHAHKCPTCGTEVRDIVEHA